MTDIFLEGGRALIGTEFVETSLSVSGTDIAQVDASRGRARLAIDARNLLVLPGGLGWRRGCLLHCAW